MNYMACPAEASGRWVRHNPSMIRCFAPDVEAEGGVVTLRDDEAQHVARVLRLRAGDVLRVFDGRGREFDAVIEQTTKSAVTVRVGAPRPVVPEPKVAVTLAQAVLKGEKMDDVVRDAVMMGVAAIQPLFTTRSEVTLSALRRGDRRGRWQRVAVASAKQCGRATVPAILEPQDFESWAPGGVQLGAPMPGKGSLPACLMLVEPSAAERAVGLSDIDPTPPCAVTLLVGPEGGWTPREIECGEACGRLVTLGARTLRADAVPIVALAALFAFWKEF